MAEESMSSRTTLSKPHMIAVVAMLSENDEYRERFVADSVAALKELEIPMAPDAKAVKIDLPDKQTLKKFLMTFLDPDEEPANAMVIYPYICV